MDVEQLAPAKYVYHLSGRSVILAPLEPTGSKTATYVSVHPLVHLHAHGELALTDQHKKHSQLRPVNLGQYSRKIATLAYALQMEEVLPAQRLDVRLRTSENEMFRNVYLAQLTRGTATPANVLLMDNLKPALSFYVD
ncbi:hypothetical protein L798_04800 [Zootermopsis nevadensis]|uniref:Uncharacterized protein n=1 Tax=Zootermopsis nevadensis TaxID=136037 RepID=A0A067RMI6_ZOONE|nr:hypothetical protein L798_04800 [Zootermopsis nevadensis]